MQSPVVNKVETWNEVEQYLMRASTPEINVPVSNLPDPSSVGRFHYTDLLSYNPDTGEVYRDSQAKESLQVRVFDAYYNVQLDAYNPEYHPIKHLIEDVIEKEYREIEPLLAEADEDTLQELKERAQTTDDSYLLGIIEDAMN